MVTTRGIRIALYGHDTYGLGHLRRNVTLAHRLARDLPEAHFLALTGSTHAHAFALPPRFDFVKIPSATKTEGGGYRARCLDLNVDELTGLRSRLIGETLLSYRPDVVIVDHAPAGMAGELIQPLDRLHAACPRTRLVLGLRDVIDEPGRVRAAWDRDGLLDWMERTYDRVLVYGAPSVGPSPEEYGLSPRLNGRVRYVHYVLEESTRVSRTVARAQLSIGRHERLVVATVGGGGDGSRVLDTLARIQAGPRPLPARVVLVTGPLMPDPDAASLRVLAHAGTGIGIVDFEPAMPRLLAAADAVVSMAGYNSMLEILASGSPAVVVPRVHPRREQWIRAQAMRRLGLCRVLHPDEANVDALREAVMDALADGPRTTPLPFPVDGTARVSQEMRVLLAESQAKESVR